MGEHPSITHQLCLGKWKGAAGMAAPRPKSTGHDGCGREVLTSGCLELRAKSVSSQTLPQGLGQVLETRAGLVEEHGS